MRPDGKVLLGIFVRTFAALAASVLIGFEGFDVVNGDRRAGAIVLALGLLAAFVAAIVAVLIAFEAGAATTPLQKAERAAAEAAIAVLGTLVFNTTADVMADEKALVGGLVTIVLAFVVTYLGGAQPVPAPTPPAG